MPARATHRPAVLLTGGAGFLGRALRREPFVTEPGLGQHFTDPRVVDFMLREVGYTAAALRARGGRDVSLCDPSCGAGAFLVAALREVLAAGEDCAPAPSGADRAPDTLCGVDVDERALRLAATSLRALLRPAHPRRSPGRGRAGRVSLYLTEDAVADFLEGGVERLGRFDFVVGNPPYVGYNECVRRGLKTFRLLRARRVALADVFGWNLHSVPGRPKRYPPKPNLYAFFMALGFALLEEGGRFCYLVPRTLLTEPDYDVIRHQLAHAYTIDKLISFAGPLFVGRGSSSGRPLATSSLIVVCTRAPCPGGHRVECLHLPDAGLDVGAALARLRLQRARYRRRIPQRTLQEHPESWSFVTWSPALRSAYARYLAASEPMSVYSEHAAAEARFGARFTFDVGYILDPARVVRRAPARDAPAGRRLIPLADFKDFTNYARFRPRSFYPWSERAIALPKASQGYAVLERRYKILWEKSRRMKFYFTDRDILPSMSHCQLIASDHREELLFLFALLNAAVTRVFYRALFELEAEQHGMFVAVRRLKEFVRPPRVATPAQRTLKARIIRLAERALALEWAGPSFDRVRQDALFRRIDELFFDLYGFSGRQRAVIARGAVALR